MSRHDPLRPSWRCASCAEPWPCQPRRGEMMEEFRDRRILLALYMARHFSEALDDHPGSPATELYARFLGWFRDSPR